MKTLLSSFRFTIVFCVLLFVGYVLVLWGIAAVVEPNRGNAELVTLNKKTVGAANVGQKFLYHHIRSYRRMQLEKLFIDDGRLYKFVF